MRWIFTVMVFACMALAGCDGDGPDITGGMTGTSAMGGGGAGGNGNGGGGANGGGGSSASSSSTTPPHEYSIAAPAEVSKEGLQDLADLDIPCTSVSPLNTEDGSWTRVVMVAPPDSILALRWMAVRGSSFAIPITWEVSLKNLSPELDPNGVDCGPGATVEVPTEVETIPFGDVDFVVLEVSKPSVSEVADGSRWIACLRNYTDADPTTEGPQPSAIVLCGVPDAGKDDRDQWQDSPADGGTIHSMCSYGPNYCGGWMVTVL